MEGQPKRKILFGRLKLQENIKMDLKYFERMTAEHVSQCVPLAGFGEHFNPYPANVENRVSS